MAGNGIIGETGKYKEENRYIHGKIVKGIAGFYYVYGEDNSGKGVIFVGNNIFYKYGYNYYCEY